MADLASHHILVRFGSGISGADQGILMLAMEKHAREHGLPVEVFKETMGDDSKLRVMMTADERAKL